MENEERHDLKDNDLREFFANFREWWGKYGNLVLIVVTIAVVAVAGYQFYTGYQTRSENAALRALSNSSTPEALAEVAKAHDVSPVPTIARLRSGDLYLDRALNPGSGENSNPPEQSLKQAAGMYQQVLDTPDVNAAYKANAQLGLAAVAESRGNFDEARGHYEQVLTLAEANGLTALADKARQRQGLLDQLATPAPFGAPQTQPGAAGTQPTLPAGLSTPPSGRPLPTPQPGMRPQPAPATQPAGQGP